MTYENKIDQLLSYATKNPEFDSKFIASMEQRLDDQKELTDKMEEAIDNIHTRFIVNTIDNSSDISKIASIKVLALMKYANENENFDPSFVNSIANKIEKKQGLTDNMLRAIDNIHSKFVENAR